MNKNNNKQILMISLLMLSVQVFCYIPIYKKTLQEYVDTIKTQNSPINASGVDIRGASIGKIVLTGGMFSGAHAEKCQPSGNTSKFAVCVPSIPTSLANSKFLSVNLS